MPSRSAALALVGCLAFLLAFSFVQPESLPQNLLRDFNAFYCAGKTVTLHADPYRNEPLGACERSADRPSFLHRNPSYLTAPAPLPGYALAPFVALALLPYAAAGCVWTLLLLLSLAWTIRRLRALTKLPLAVLLAALLLSDGYVGITLGQIAPLAIAAIVEAAYAITQGRLLAAACACAVSMLEPHIGLPACLALLAFAPRTLLPLSACASVLLALSVALLGIPNATEYLTNVIGAHALSEALNVKQLSLTVFLARIGVPALLAVRIGTLWYAGMILAGIVVGGRTARALERPALAVLIPVAFAMIGGPFVHIAQIAAVVPAALLLADARRADRFATLGLLLLAVPWPQFASMGTSFPFLAAIAEGILAFELLPKAPIWRVAPPLLTLLLTTLPTQLLQPIADPAAQLLAAYDPHAFAQTSWGAYVGLVGTQNAFAYDIARMPTVTGLLFFAKTSAKLAGAAGGD